MSSRSVTSRARGAALVVAAMLFGGVISPGRGQDLAQISRGPRFLREVARGQPRVEIDLRSTPLLYRRIAIDGNQRTLGDLLAVIAKQAGLQLVYSADLIPVNRPIRFRADSITVAAALTEVLVDVGVDVVFYTPRQAGLVRRGASGGPFGAISGRVTDAKTGEGLRATEVWLDNNPGTATDSIGWYHFAAVDTGAHTLTVRRLGYRRASQGVVVRPDREDTVHVALEPVVARLDELVTTATGQQRRRDIANDVTVIKPDSVMQAAPIRTLTDLLENRVPGLTVQRTSGAPGDPARLRLRGPGSPLRSNDPIVIVDGIRIYAEQSAKRGGNLATITSPQGLPTYAAPSPLDYIDPNSIETLEVLKGPSAATLYGQDAANGVIVITTKRGRPGPARWSTSVEYGRTQMVGDYPELYFRWGHDIFHGAPLNCLASNLVNTLTLGSGGGACVADSVRRFQLLNDPALTVLDRGHLGRLSLSVSGGTQALTYAVTGTYRDEMGLVKLPAYEADRYQTSLGLAPPSWMQRPQNLRYWAATSTIQARLGSKANVALTTNLSRSNQQRSSLETELGALMTTYLDQVSGIYYRGNSNGVVPFTGTVLSSYSQRATDVATQFTNSAALNWLPRRWLTVDADAGLSVVHRDDETFTPRGLFGSTDTMGKISNGQGASVVATVNLRTNALAPMGRGFLLRFAAGINYAGTSTSDVAGGSQNLAPGSSLQGATIIFLNRAEQSDATFGWYVEPSIGNSRFNFSSGLRLDGGGAYGSGVRGLSLPKFPKLGFSYLVSDDPLFPFKSVFQSFRVRLAYGRASRQPGPKDRLRLYNLASEVLLDGEFQTAVSLLTLGNAEVRPERSTEFEGGFDADLLDSRLSVSFTGYRKTTDDALLNVPVALSVYGNVYGNNVTIVKNIGVIRNTGFDVTAGVQLVRSGPVTWQTRMQLSQNRNMVVRLGPGVQPFYTDADVGGGLRVTPGYPLFGRWSRPITGYADASGNGVLEWNEIQLGDTAVYAGSTVPDYTASLTTTISLWHGALTVDAGFARDGGLAQRNTVAEKLALFSRGAQVPGTSLAEQAATIRLGVPGSFSSVTDYNWIQTVSTTRFNSLSVRYNVPTAVTRRLGAQTLSVAIQGSNLGLWTNYRGLDPNVNAFSTGNNVTDTGILPQPRTWQVRVNATY